MGVETEKGIDCGPLWFIFGKEAKETKYPLIMIFFQFKVGKLPMCLAVGLGERIGKRCPNVLVSFMDDLNVGGLFCYFMQFLLFCFFWVNSIYIACVSGIKILLLYYHIHQSKRKKQHLMQK